MSEIEKIERNLILNSDKRIFKGWATVEIRDNQGDIIPIEKIAEAMPAYINRGGVITLAHSNKIIGKVLSYELKEKDNNLGILITGQIFNDYEIDKAVWEKIKSGEYDGLSISGYLLKDEKGEINKAELIEIAITPKPVNQEAKVIVMSQVAKSEEIKKEEVKKQDEDVELDKKILELLNSISAKLDAIASALEKPKSEEKPMAEIPKEEEKSKAEVKIEEEEKCNTSKKNKSEDVVKSEQVAQTSRPIQTIQTQPTLTAKDIAKGKTNLDLIKFVKELRF